MSESYPTHAEKMVAKYTRAKLKAIRVNAFIWLFTMMLAGVNLAFPGEPAVRVLLVVALFALGVITVTQYLISGDVAAWREQRGEERYRV
jgi:hypothetical protein